MEIKDPFTHDHAPTSPFEANPSANESLADWIVTLTAMCGAIAGAVAGAALGAVEESACPIACGTLGTLLGSGLFVLGGLYVIVPMWSTLFARKADHAQPPVAAWAGHPAGATR